MGRGAEPNSEWVWPPPPSPPPPGRGGGRGAATENRPHSNVLWITRARATTEDLGEARHCASRCEGGSCKNRREDCCHCPSDRAQPIARSKAFQRHVLDRPPHQAA